MKNIKFNYLYRDAGNYKVRGEIIFSNADALAIDFIETEIRKNLIDGKFFDPEEFKIKRLVHLDFPYHPELDHSWNEYDCIEETNDLPSDRRSIKEFIQFIVGLKIPTSMKA